MENLKGSVKKLHDRLKFKFDEVSQKLTLIWKRHTSVRRSPPLARLLGFDMTDIPYGRNEESRVSDLDQGFSSLYVYRNVVQPTVIGDTFVPLLRIVPVDGKKQATSSLARTRTFNTCRFKRILSRSWKYRSPKTRGELVPFERGKAVVTLHFRKVGSL